MKIFSITRSRVHPDEPHKWEHKYDLDIVAGSMELAKEMARIHGIDDGEIVECLCLYEPTPDGMITHFSADGKTFDESFEDDDECHE